MKTRAAVLWEIGGDWSVEDIELDPPKAGEVLIKMHTAGICHSDEHLRCGHMAFPPEWGMPDDTPIIGGHEGSGIVQEVGEGVIDLAPGDHIVFSFVPSCGRCKWCTTGRSFLCDLGAHLMGGNGQISDFTHRHHHAKADHINTMVLIGSFAEHTVVNQASVVKIDPDIPLEAAALVSCGVSTGWGSAVERAGVKAGDNVVVIGIGGIGMNAVQGAAMAGALRVIAIDPIEWKRDIAKQFGATHSFASIEEAMPEVQAMTWGIGAEKVIVCPGDVPGDMVDAALNLTAKAGTCVITGLAPLSQMDAQLNLFMFSMMNKELKGTVFGSLNPRAAMPELLKLYMAGQLKLDELITNRYTLDNINQGFKDLHDGKNLRGVITFA
ncbi:MAG: NDMA-dependent alcohol dehydrogenase [Acidimicrobiia bacterium]